MQPFTGALVLFCITHTITQAIPRLTPLGVISQVFKERNERKIRYEEIVCHVADISFVVDSSRSIYPPDFEKGLEFLSNLTSHFQIGPNRVRVSTVLYGDRVYTDTAFGFDKYLSNANLSRAILDLEFRAGDRTFTGKALKYMREKQMVLARPGVERVVVVLTDGKSSDNPSTVSEAAATKAKGIKIIAIGVGSGTDHQELLDIASSEETMFQVRSYSELDSIMDSLGAKTCIVEVHDESCGEKAPSDIYFVFDSPYLGGQGSEKCSQFIETVLSQEEMDEGMQVGVISGRCGDVKGFELDRYDDPVDIKTHLSKFSQTNLPGLVHELGTEGYSADNGGRTDARRVAVLFVGGKFPEEELKRRTKEARDNDIMLYVVNLGDADPKLLAQLSYSPPDHHVLSGQPMEDLAREFVSKLCKDI